MNKLELAYNHLYPLGFATECFPLNISGSLAHYAARRTLIDHKPMLATMKFLQCDNNQKQKMIFSIMYVPTQTQGTAFLCNISPSTLVLLSLTTGSLCALARFAENRPLLVPVWNLALAFFISLLLGRSSGRGRLACVLSVSGLLESTIDC
jgi:hypothetical protein